MPDANGRFRGISVPALPWHRPSHPPHLHEWWTDPDGTNHPCTICGRPFPENRDKPPTDQ